MKTIGAKAVIKYFGEKSLTEKFTFFSLIFASIATSIISLLLPIYFSQIIDLISSFGGGDKSILMDNLIDIIVVILFLEIGSLGSRRLFGFSLVKLEILNMKKIFLESFAYLHKHSYRFFTNNFGGSLVKKVNKLAYSYENIIDIFSFRLIRLLIFLPFIVITVFLKNNTLGSIFLGFIIVYGISQFFLYKWNLPNDVKANKEDSKVIGVLADTITNNFNILSFSSINREITYFTKTLNKWKKIQFKARNRNEIIHVVGSTLLVIFEVLLLYFAVTLRGKDMITTGTIVLVQMYMFKIFEQMLTMGNVFKRLNKSIGESAEMLEILKTPHEIQDKKGAKELNVHTGIIDFQNVCFGYNNDSIFKNLSLHIKPGEKIAFVGESGAGKTSIIKILMRFFDIQKGKILIDQQNIAHVTQNSLRNNMSLVPQDPILFHRTIKENISYGRPDASDQEIIAAAKMARAHRFIVNLQDQYDTYVGERGIKLSGGERQRIAIARAILENKQILLLDEATSALDSESEQLIQEAMETLMRKKTVIIVAHRLSTVMKMDRIIVLDKGDIVEEGSHKTLLAKKGTYAKLRNIQSGGFID